MDSIDVIQEMGTTAGDGETAEDVAIARFTAVRWKHGAFCPHCGFTQVYHFSDNRTHKCGSCRQRFSLKMGTIFGDSKIGLAPWLTALQLATTSKTGITAKDLAQLVGVSRKTAAHMLDRIRLATQTPSFNQPIEAGVITADTLSNKSRLRPGLRTGDPVV